MLESAEIIFINNYIIGISRKNLKYLKYYYSLLFQTILMLPRYFRVTQHFSIDRSIGRAIVCYITLNNISVNITYDLTVMNFKK